MLSLFSFCVEKSSASAVISVRLWNFKDGGSLKARFLAKNQYTGKPLYFENTGSTSSSKIGHDFRKKSGSKIEVRKKKFFTKNGLLN